MRILLGVFVSSLLGGSAFAEKRYLLAKKGHVPPAGTVATSKTEMEMEELELQIKAGGQDFGGSMSLNETEEESFEYLTPTKIRYSLKADDEIQQMTMAGQEMPAEEMESPLVGVPVVLERKGEKEELSAAQKERADEIADGLEDDGEEYGYEPRKVGETWEVDAENASELFGDGEITDGSVKITLLEIVNKGGLECAKCRFEFDLSGEPEEGMKLGMKGTATVYRSLKYFTDIDVEAKFKISMNGEAAEGVTMTG